MASHLDIALVEWPSSAELGGPRLLGRIADRDLVEAVRARLAAAYRREIAQLERPAVRLVGDTPEDGAA
jgi:hypothetical protein